MEKYLKDRSNAMWQKIKDEKIKILFEDKNFIFYSYQFKDYPAVYYLAQGAVINIAKDFHFYSKKEVKLLINFCNKLKPEGNLK